MSEDQLIGIIYSQLLDEFTFNYSEKDLWMIAENISEKIASQQPQLNDDQKIVFEQLKLNAGSEGSPMRAILSVYSLLYMSSYRLKEDGALESLKVRNAFARLTRKQEAEVIQAFSDWVLEQEEDAE